MNILYIGQYTDGTTSKMRADQLKQIFTNSPSTKLEKNRCHSGETVKHSPLTFNPSTFNPNPLTFNLINTHIPFNHSPRLWRSLGFRYKRGPLIRNVNSYILKQVQQQLKSSTIPTSQHPNIQTSKPPKAKDVLTTNCYQLIWIDKAIFLTPKTTQYLKSLTDKLVHFTPDPAFTFHKSHLFRSSLSLYDYVITTKAYELDYFKKYLPADQIIYATQGFDHKFHKPLTQFKDKKEGLIFIGHCEKEREVFCQKLIDNQISISIAGIKWEHFVEKNKNSEYLNYLGNGIYGDDYVMSLSAYQFSWGSISKWIPELHTTRTFEIPACGTALITERNTETTAFFKEDEAIFYDSIDEMIEKIQYYQDHPAELETLTLKGTKRVHQDGRDYESILRKVLKEIGGTSVGL